MSMCIIDLYDYELAKKCSKCKTISLKSNFYKDITKKDSYRPSCKRCTNQFYYDNRNQINTRMNEYFKNRTKTDVNFRLIRNTRRRIHHALNGKTKPSSTKDILGIDIDLYRKWIEFQFTPEMNWSNIEIDHVKAICLFDVSKDEELKEAFSWKNTQPLLKHDHHQKGTKFNFLDYQNQFIKAYQFIKLNGQEGLN